MTDINIDEFEKSDKLTVNAMPSKTWYWLGVNDASLSWDMASEKFLKTDEITINDKEKHEDIWLDLSDAEESFNKKEIKLITKEESTVTVIANYALLKNVRIVIDINAGVNSKVKLIQVLTAAENSIYNEVNASCEKNAEFELIQVFAGKKSDYSLDEAGKIYSNVKVELAGDASDFVYNMGYLGQGGNVLDYNIIVNHTGKNTNCNINASGALKDNATKIFRGTIDFKKGASGSVGAETETVLMLGEDVVNKTVPVILCSEENVSGTHGATIGELDEETLFYFESRGIDKKNAENIMARAAIERLTGITENEKVNAVIDNTLKEVLGDD